MRKYHELFDQIEPQMSDDALLSAIYKAGTTKVKRRKKLIPVFVAAAICLVSTITVSAYRFGLVDAVRSFFSDRDHLLSDDMPGSDFVIVENTFDALEFSVSGCVTDGVLTFIFFEIGRTDGQTFNNAEYILSDEKGSEIILSDGETFRARPTVKFSRDRTECMRHAGIPFHVTSRCYPVIDDDPLDSRVTMAYCLSDLTEQDVKTVRLDLEDLYSETFYGVVDKGLVFPRVASKESIDGHLICDVNMEQMTYISERTVLHPDVTAALPFVREHSIEVGSHPFQVKEVTLSAIGVEMKLEGDFPENPGYVQTTGVGTVTLKDGTSLLYGNEVLPQIVKEWNNDGTWHFEGYFIFPQTVALDDIASVTIGDRTIPVS